MVKIRADEAVAALDVLRPGPARPARALKQVELPGHRYWSLPFQDLEQQGQLGHFHGLGVNVHPVDMVQEDALALRDGQFIVAPGNLVNAGVAAFGPFAGVLGVGFQVPIQQKLIGPQEKGAGTAGRVQDPESGSAASGDRASCPPPACPRSGGRYSPRCRWGCNRRRRPCALRVYIPPLAWCPAVRRMTLPRNCS